MAGQEDQEREQGFTLIELLIAIVVVGILTAVAIVGIGGLVDNGHVAACQSSADAAKAASAVFFSNSSPGIFPSDFHDMIAPKTIYEIPTGVTPNPPAAGDMVLTGNGWTLTMSVAAGTEPKFVCS